jgi:hypothetical protein
LGGAAGAGVDVVDADLLDGQVRQVRGFDAGALRGSQPRLASEETAAAEAPRNPRRELVLDIVISYCDLPDQAY